MITPSLIDILKVPTEIKPEFAPAFFDEVLEIPPIVGHIEALKPKKEHFAPKPTEEIKTEIKPEKSSFSENLNTANGIIAIYDIFQTLTFPYGYKKSMFKKGEWKKIQELRIRMRQNTETILNEKDLVLMDKLDTFNDLRENVPFTEKEIAAISVPLAKVLGKYNLKLGAEMILFSSLVMIALPRIMPFFSPLEDL